MSAPLTPRDRVNAVLDVLCADGVRPDVEMDWEGHASAEFPLNDTGDRCQVEAFGEASVAIEFVGTLDRAKRVAAFIAGMDAEEAPAAVPADPEIIGAPSPDAPPLTLEQILAAEIGDEVWIGPNGDGDAWCLPHGWHTVEGYGDDDLVPLVAGGSPVGAGRIRARRPRREG